jgi:hypothetical protein
MTDVGAIAGCTTAPTQPDPKLNPKPTTTVAAPT